MILFHCTALMLRNLITFFLRGSAWCILIMHWFVLMCYEENVFVVDGIRNDRLKFNKILLLFIKVQISCYLNLYDLYR